MVRASSTQYKPCPQCGQEQIMAKSITCRTCMRRARHERATERATPSAPDPNGCIHSWQIEAGGENPTSAGTCGQCGEVKEFKNWIEYNQADYLIARYSYSVREDVERLKAARKDAGFSKGLSL